MDRNCAIWCTTQNKAQMIPWETIFCSCNRFPMVPMVAFSKRFRVTYPLKGPISLSVDLILSKSRNKIICFSLSRRVKRLKNIGIWIEIKFKLMTAIAFVLSSWMLMLHTLTKMVSSVLLKKVVLSELSPPKLRHHHLGEPSNYYIYLIDPGIILPLFLSANNDHVSSRRR